MPLVVKRLKQRVRLIDQLLDSLARWILKPIGRRGDTHGNVGERRTESRDADSQTNPKERTREAPILSVGGLVMIAICVVRSHLLFFSRSG